MSLKAKNKAKKEKRAGVIERMNQSYEKEEIEMLGNVPIKTAARLMQKSEMFVRMGLRSGALPFGVAIHASSKKSWAYHISPAKFAAYMGIEPADLAAECGGANE